MNFAQIIHPISVEEFFNDYYEKKPLYIARNSATYYHTFLNLPEIDSYIQLKQTFSPNVKMAFEGKEVSPLLFCDNDNDVAPFKANPQKMLALFKQGYTIKYDKLHQTYPPLASKVSFLENEIGLKIRTSLYITPENSQGYGVHTDRHDVLALQLNGTKIWKVKYSEEILPSLYDGKVLPTNWEDGAQEIHLQAGDFFYCPRGLAHDVYTKDESSIHYTLGFQPMYGYKAMEYLSELAYENAFFRKALPNKLFSEGQKERFANEFKNEFKKFIDGIDIDALLNKKSKESTSSLIEFSENRFLSQFYQPSASDIFMINPNISWQLSFTKVACRIELDRISNDFPFLLKDFFSSLKNKSEFSIHDMGTELNEKQKLKLVKRLMKLKMIEVKK